MHFLLVYLLVFIIILVNSYNRFISSKTCKCGGSLLMIQLTMNSVSRILIPNFITPNIAKSGLHIGYITWNDVGTSFTGTRCICPPSLSQ
jgi:hypothetical protein